LTDAVGQLTATFNDWSGLLVNAEYIRREQTISWQNAGRPMLPENVTFADVALMAEARQYSFQLLTDGSLFQLFYRYDSDAQSLTDAVLAYYEGRSSEDDDEEALRQGTSSDLARWLRIDFNSTDVRCSLHNDAHMHVSGFPGTRIPLDGVPTPKQFVELVMAWCYPELFAEHCLQGGLKGPFRDGRRQDWVHENSFPFVDDELFRHVVHVKFPRR
jgi:hypothetical protein